MKFTSVLGLSALLAASPALAHYRFYKLIANGQLHDEFKYIRPFEAPFYNGPTQDVYSTDIRCHMKARPAADVITVSAGSDVGFQVDGAIVHPGPFTAYLAKAPANESLTTWDGNGDWFKIWEQGALESSPEKVVWDEGVNTKWMFKIPKNVPSGKYLLRFEHIGLHGAWAKAEAQFYISCAQLDIVGGSEEGAVTPGPTIKFPGGYSDEDPGIFINIFWPVPHPYQIPGPAVWTGQ